MADLSITAASVAARGTGKTRDGAGGAEINAGQVVARDADVSFKMADSNSGTARLRSPIGIALHAAATGQPLKILTSGEITIGATLTAGVAYFLSDTPGGICPAADLSSGEY